MVPYNEDNKDNDDIAEDKFIKYHMLGIVLKSLHEQF